MCVPQDEGKGGEGYHISKILRWKGETLRVFRLSWHQSSNKRRWQRERSSGAWEFGGIEVIFEQLQQG